MTTIDHDVRRRHRVLTVVACGVLLGVVDLLLQRGLPYPWANLANSSAVWALGAFGIGWWLRGGWWRSALAGIVLLVVAVEAYYLAAVVVLNDDARTLWSSTAVMWSFFGVLAGALFGAAGGLSHDRRPWRRAIAVAMPGAVLLAESAVLVDRSGNPGGGPRYRADSLQTAAIEATLGVVLILFIAPTHRVRLQALAAAAALAAVGFAGFSIAGFGS
ncbi:hypothetical protein GCM10010172_66010 [Paractinoplanes ferrugineus]|uniref:Uncharacterized protein n=1 Tax=Paractinoplanes ferrugineus TaxID=113564 RepID=A0A919J3F6_9ACTN|nr:DUF6518 family protein [Actinoplanes ferrugineus]GIE13238.1 hypothetical protein Afe05nite_50780 [Actinoplanes ferrugineus]